MNVETKIEAETSLESYLEVVVRPSGNAATFLASIDGEEILDRATTSPLIAVGRVLHEMGVDGSVWLEMRHEGSEVVSIRATLGQVIEADPKRKILPV